MNEVIPAYGEGRDRGPTVSYDEIERAARALMLDGERPTVQAVRTRLGRGSPNHIAISLQKFWKNQAALNAGDPIALTRLPPELADAAVDGDIDAVGVDARQVEAKLDLVLTADGVHPHGSETAVVTERPVELGERVE